MTRPARESSAPYPREAPRLAEPPAERLRREGFVLGDWRVEPRRHRIVSAETTRTLDKRLLDVLVALAAADGEVVTRDELMGTVWEGTFVSENSLSQAVSRLRRALGDDRHDPRYIETISRSGYRLRAAVRSGTEKEVRAPSEDRQRSRGQAPVSDRSLVPGVWALAALAAVAVVLAAAFVQTRAPVRPSPLAPRPVVRPEVTLVGNQFGPRLAPSGDRVAFAWRGAEPEGDWDIWLQPVGGDNPVKVTDDPQHERLATFSPDGQRLAFVRFSTPEKHCGIFVMPVLGGPAEHVGECLPSLRSLDWSPDGAALTHDGIGDAGVRALFLLDLASGERRQLTDPPAGIRGDIGGRFSPDGTLIAFERESGPFREDVAVVRVADGSTMVLTDGRWGRMRGVDWTADGASILFSSNRSGRFALWQVSPAGGAPERLPIDDDWVTQPSAARAGGRLIYRTFRDAVDVWELTLDEWGAAAAEPTLRVASSRNERQPVWSPRSDAIAFLSDRSGTLELWTGRADGTDLMRHTALDGPFPGSPAWSTDGAMLVFDAAVDGQSDLWLVGKRSRRPRRLRAEASDERNGVFSRDGRHLYFTSNRGGGWDLWRMPVAGGEAARMTVAGCFLAQESTDGRRLFFTRIDQPGIWTHPPDGGEAERVIADLDPMDWGSWVVGERGIYYLRRNPTAIAFADLVERSTRVVFAPAKQIPYQGRALSLSADGRALLFTLIDHSDDEIMTVDL